MIRRTEKELDRLVDRLSDPSADRYSLVQRGRALTSVLAANPDIDIQRVRSISHGFLLEPEVSLSRHHRLVIPPPRHSRVGVIVDEEELSDSIRPTRRWGNASNAKSRIEYWLRNNEFVSVIAGKFRVLNMGELDALWKAKRKTRRLVVAVASHDLCKVDKEFDHSQYTPPIEDRMQQLADVRFPDGSRVDYIYHNDADAFFLAGGQLVNYLPFHFFHIPDAQTQSDFLLSQEARLAELTGRASRLELWKDFANRYCPSTQQKEFMRNFRWCLTQDPSRLDQLRTQESIFGLFGGKIAWLPQHRYGSAISSSEIMRRWGLTPQDEIRVGFLRDEQVSERDAVMMARVKALSRVMAVSGCLTA